MGQREMTNRNTGLTSAEAADLLQKCGRNELTEKQKQSALSIFLDQLKSPMVALLAASAALSLFFQEWMDGIAILTVILINTIVGFFMEYKAERSMEALQKMVSPTAKVFRDGELREIPSAEIVPGDLVFLEAGDIVPADGVISEMAQLQVDESALTGESVPVEKSLDPVPDSASLAEQTNRLFKGTYVTRGQAKATITRTGMKTELGRIAGLVQSARPSATPLEKKLRVFSQRLIMITLLLVGVVFAFGLSYGQSILQLLKTSIALAVAAIPEGLPIVATLALANGMLRMARRNVIVKKLASVETLGGTNVICSDKTGTLTMNRMDVCWLYLGNIGSALKPDIKNRSIIFPEGREDVFPDSLFDLAVRVSILCSTSELSLDENGVRAIGDPMEIGLLKFAYSTGADIKQVRSEFPKVSEVPFDSKTRMMITVHCSADGCFTAAKGSVEELLKKCRQRYETDGIAPLSEEDHSRIIQDMNEAAAQGIRIIGLACAEQDAETVEPDSELIWLGMIGVMDPPREDVPDAIAQCKQAGIEVVMITGDHPLTAASIAGAIGIDAGQVGVLTGKDIRPYEQLSPEDKEKLLDARVFARVSPENKLDLISIQQEAGNIVAMTGDGVNDAPALQKADIGVAMGLRGTQVAQDVADMVLRDDAFTSIVEAISQGRVIFENIRKFITYLLSCNLSELFIIALAAALDLPFQLLPLQILFINLVTDVLPALAIGISRGGKGLMCLPPRHPATPIVERKNWIAIFVYSGVIAACVTATVFLWNKLVNPGADADPLFMNNVLFFTLIAAQLLHVFNVSSVHKGGGWLLSEEIRNVYVWLALGLCTLITLGAPYVGPVAEALRLRPLGMEDLVLVSGGALASAIIIRILKVSRIVI